MANPWFRVYAEFATDPKVQMMSECMQRRLLMLMCFRCNETIETLHETELAFAFRISHTELAETKTVFMAKNFIDENWNLINWDKRQFASDNSTKRVRAFREKQKQAGLFDETFRNGFGNAPDTDTDTEQIQSRTEPKQIKNVSVNSVPDSHTELHEAVDRVFAYYCSALGRNPLQYALTPDRRAKAESRLRERLRAHLNDLQKAEGDLATAVFNLAENEYNRDNGYIDWNDHIFKSQECFEKRLNWMKVKGAHTNGNGNRGQARTNGNIQAAEEAQRIRQRERDRHAAASAG